MSATTCPVCGKAVDTLRARAVGVRDGKVVAYCSADCAKQAGVESGAIVKPATTPAAAPTPEPTKGKGKKAEPTPVPGAAAASAKDRTKTPVPGRTKTPVPKSDEPAVPTVNLEAMVRQATEAGNAKPPRAKSEPRAATDGEASDGAGADKPRSKAGIVIAVIVAAAAGGIAWWKMSAGDHARATPKRAHATLPDAQAAGSSAGSPTESAPPPPAAPAVSPAAAVDRARDILRKQLASESPRVQRVAAAALARTGDADAITALAAMISKETSDIAKLDIAYALARAGDKRGTDALTAALANQRRDVRAEAARLLALLGDPRAVPVLADYLDVSQLRLGAAEQLAHLAEPRAIKALDQVRADPKATPDDKARATIALGIAGRADVAPALHALLDDARFNAFAAAALAQLHDAAAQPVLIKQLDVPSLRVAAARALRRLDPKLDLTPQLAALLAALDSGKDTEQVQIAEAILLLAGPPEWAEHE